MTQSYVLKNLPAPLLFWIRPMLLISVSLHGLLLAAPMPSEKKPEAPKKEPEKVKITQLPTKPATVASTPKVSLTPIPKTSPVMVQPKLIPIQAAAPIRPQTTPPIISTALPRPPEQPKPNFTPTPPPPPPKPSFSPSPSPTPSPTQTPTQQASPSPKPSPTPTQTPTQQASASPSPSPTPSTSPTPTQAATTPPVPTDPFADFPRYTNAQPGSIGVLSEANDKAAFHTSDGLTQVAGFYEQELNKKQFKPQLSSPPDDSNLKIYQVAKGGATQFLHLISREGKTVIVLAPQQITDIKALKDAGEQSPQERAFYAIIQQVENELDLASFEPGDIAKLAEPTKFADASGNADLRRFTFRNKTTSFKPKSPAEIADILKSNLMNKGFADITQAGNYGGGTFYKIKQETFTIYMGFVTTSDNKTVIVLSKDFPT